MSVKFSARLLHTEGTTVVSTSDVWLSGQQAPLLTSQQGPSIQDLKIYTTVTQLYNTTRLPVRVTQNTLWNARHICQQAKLNYIIMIHRGQIFK